MVLFVTASSFGRLIYEHILLRSNRFNKMFLPRLQRVYKPYLKQFFPFYNRLNDKDQLLFENRVQKFINLKEFIPRGGLAKVTPMMKVFIAGSAIQLTFGYPSIYFRHFRRILIYPDDYYSRITQRYHKGEVNRGGIIVVSWSNLRQGFEDHTDGKHLGLHEMAHALRLINVISNNEYGLYNRKVMKEFDAEAHKEMEKIAAGNGSSIFRSYGAVHIEEFFAVAVEMFFEMPEQFRNYNELLYNLMAKVLKIDPSDGRFSNRGV
jgi:MtfA peptidase